MWMHVELLHHQCHTNGSHVGPGVADPIPSSAQQETEYLLSNNLTDSQKRVHLTTAAVAIRSFSHFLFLRHRIYVGPDPYPL